MTVKQRFRDLALHFRIGSSTFIRPLALRTLSCWASMSISRKRQTDANARWFLLQTTAHRPPIVFVDDCSEHATILRRVTLRILRDTLVVGVVSGLTASTKLLARRLDGAQIPDQAAGRPAGLVGSGGDIANVDGALSMLGFDYAADGITNDRESFRRHLAAAAAHRRFALIDRPVFVDIRAHVPSDPIELVSGTAIVCQGAGKIVVRNDTTPVLFAFDVQNVDLSRVIFERYPQTTFTVFKGVSSDADRGAQAFFDARLRPRGGTWRGVHAYRAVVYLDGELTSNARLGSRYRVRPNARVAEYFDRCISVNGPPIPSPHGPLASNISLDGLDLDGVIMGACTAGIDGLSGNVRARRMGSRAIFSGGLANEPPPHAWYNTGYSRNVTLAGVDEGLEPPDTASNGQCSFKPREVDRFRLSFVSFRRQGCCDFSGRSGRINVRSRCELAQAGASPNGVPGFRWLDAALGISSDVEANVTIDYTDVGRSEFRLVQLPTRSAAQISNSRLRLTISVEQYPNFANDHGSASEPLFPVAASGITFDCLLTFRTPLSAGFTPFLFRNDAGSGGNRIRFWLSGLSRPSYRMNTAKAVIGSSWAEVIDVTGDKRHVFANNVESVEWQSASVRSKPIASEFH